MSIPGSNIYLKAIQLIARQVYVYYAFTGRTIDDRGRPVNTYAAPVTLRDSIQALPREYYQQLGLDFSRDAITVFTNSALFSVDRDYSGDQIVYRDATFQLLSSTDWSQQDGWREVYAVKLAAETAL